MPELPEVETTKRGILPHLSGKSLTQIDVRVPKLRYPIPLDTLNTLINHPLIAINRRAKYLLLHFESLSLIIHLGMSGSLRILPPDTPWRKHDHWQLTFDHIALRYHDPRRFGFLLTSDKPEEHSLLNTLGPEPLSDAFSATYLYNLLSKRKSPIKSCLMDNKVVVGVGNIYACESLFLAAIAPNRPANTLKKSDVTRLHQYIVDTLKKAILQGGSTLKDFVNPNGSPGYFAQTLHVYGREGLPCPRCKSTKIENIKIGGRSSFYCPHCQH